MKILHLNINEKLGGAAQAAHRLHQELLKSGFESSLLVISKETRDESVIGIAEVYSKKEKLLLLLRKILRIIRTILHIKKDNRYDPPSKLLGVLERMDFDIIHLHWVTESFINLKELTSINKPIVWTMHDCAAFTGVCNVIGTCTNYMEGCGNCPLLGSKSKNDVSSKEYKRKQKLYKFLNFNLVSPSFWLAERASLSPLAEGKPISIIPHGLNTELFSPLKKIIARECFNLNSEAKIIICGAVNLADDNKGFQFLEIALKKISSSYKESHRTELLLFGENNNKNNFSGLKTTNLGFITDERLLRIVYSLADVMVVPSKQEAFGLTALEAMSCGTPVVAFAVSGLLDMVDHKKNGYLAIPYKSDDLATGIIWCLENNAQNELSSEARRKVLECFGIKMEAQKYIELYNRINY